MAFTYRAVLSLSLICFIIVVYLGAVCGLKCWSCNSEIVKGSCWRVDQAVGGAELMDCQTANQTSDYKPEYDDDDYQQGNQTEDYSDYYEGGDMACVSVIKYIKDVPQAIIRDCGIGDSGCHEKITDESKATKVEACVCYESACNSKNYQPAVDESEDSINLAVTQNSASLVMTLVTIQAAFLVMA